MIVIDFQKLLKEHQPELYHSQFTEQYRLADKMIENLHRLKLRQNQLADMMGLDLETYLEMEKGTDKIPVECYKEALNLLFLRLKLKGRF